MDEPAGRFRADQMPVLYDLVREARVAGKAVLYAATTADEVFRAADRVSIVRNGRVIGTQDAAAFDRESLVALVDLANSFPESREDLVRENIELLKYKRYNDELISNLPLGAVILDAAGRVTLANGVARTILGAAEGAPLSEALARLESGLRTEMVDVARQGRRGEWGKVKVEGGRTLSVMAFPFHDAAGGALGTILAVQDITEELATREYLARAERASSIAELSAGVAHEVNNPLAIISNYVELLLMRPQEGYTSERLAIIRDEIKRIHGIVASLLPFARVGAACLQQVDLAEVAGESLLLLSHEADRRGILLKADLPVRPLTVRADPSRIKQVMINLVLNALEALPVGGRIGVTLRPGDAEGTVQLVVEDDGPGIDPARLGTLFKPFAATTKGPGHALLLKPNHLPLSTFDDLRTSFSPSTSWAASKEARGGWRVGVTRCCGASAAAGWAFLLAGGGLRYESPSSTKTCEQRRSRSIAALASSGLPRIGFHSWIARLEVMIVDPCSYLRRTSS